MQSKNQHLPFLILMLVAATAIVGLDFITWKRGGKSIFFPQDKFREKPLRIPYARSLRETVLKHLEDLDIATDTINQYRDNEGILHMMVELTPKKYSRLDSDLTKELARTLTRVNKSEKQEDELSKYYLWQVRSSKDQLLYILFHCVEEKPEAEQPPISSEAQNLVAIIIDDMGYSLGAIDRITELNVDFTIAILPFSPLAKETASIAHQNDLEVILHLPLESINNTDDNNNTDGIIHSQMSPDEIIKRLEENLEEIPYVHGINTHMGSKITSDENLMNIILTYIREKDLFFIDSRTTPRSVAFDMAKAMGIPCAERNVFLDNEINEDNIRGQLLKLYRKAQEEGQAIGICHPTPETLRTLKKYLHLMSDYDVRIVHASQIVKINHGS